MRSIEDIKADIAKCEEAEKIYAEHEDLNGNYWAINYLHMKETYIAELRLTLTASIPLDRLSEICNAEREGRCEIFPYKRDDRIYVVDDNVKKGYRTTRLNYYQSYVDGTTRHIIAKTTAVEHWYDLDEIFPTLDAVKDTVKIIRQKKRDACLKQGRTCSECKNDYCNARAEAEAAKGGAI